MNITPRWGGAHCALGATSARWSCSDYTHAFKLAAAGELAASEQVSHCSGVGARKSAASTLGRNRDLISHRNFSFRSIAEIVAPDKRNSAGHFKRRPLERRANKTVCSLSLETMFKSLFKPTAATEADRWALCGNLQIIALGSGRRFHSRARCLE